MTDALKTLLLGGVLTAVGWLLVTTGVVQLSIPDLGLPSLPRDVVVQERVLGPKHPATITRVEPIALDCRARVHATVSVEGTREHSLAGLVYRTDTVSLDAVGDVDTCVDAGAVVIGRGEDGTLTVTVPGEAISFVRPRVDMVASATGVDWDKGFLGELTDLLPGVDDGDDMIAGAFAYAQQVVGGRACMQEAFAVTSQALEQAYADQLLAQGLDPAMITVEVGEPDFDQHLPFEGTSSLAFRVDDDIRCTLSPDAHAGASPSWEDLAGEV